MLGSVLVIEVNVVDEVAVKTAKPSRTRIEC